MRISKTLLVWFGEHCLNFWWMPGVRFVDWLFRLLPKLRAA